MAYFLTETELKERVPVDQNVHGKNIPIAISGATVYYLREALGKDYFAELQTKLDSDTLTAVEEALVNEYIKPFLAQWVYYELLGYLYVRTSQNGLQQPISSGGQGIDQTIFFHLRKQCKTQAEFFKMQLIEYLHDNSGLFPTWAKEDTYYNGQTLLGTNCVPRIFW